MQTKIHILTQSPRLDPFIEKIQTGASSAVEKIERTIKLPVLDIVIVDEPDAAILGTGVGGYTPHPHLIFVWIDPKHKDLEKTIEEKVRRVITHECHHAARIVTFPWNETNLLDAFIIEGLGDHFDIELNEAQPYPWSIALDENEVQKYFDKAKSSELLSKEYDYPSWFYGSKEKGIPRWAGYTIGFKLVGDYIKKTGRSASKLIDTPASDFIE